MVRAIFNFLLLKGHLFSVCHTFYIVYCRSVNTWRVTVYSLTGCSPWITYWGVLYRKPLLFCLQVQQAFVEIFTCLSVFLTVCPSICHISLFMWTSLSNLLLKCASQAYKIQRNTGCLATYTSSNSVIQNLVPIWSGQLVIRRTLAHRGSPLPPRASLPCNWSCYNSMIQNLVPIWLGRPVIRRTLAHRGSPLPPRASPPYCTGHRPSLSYRTS